MGGAALGRAVLALRQALQNARLDPGLAARKLHDATDANECLRESRVGRMMLERGLEHEVAYAAAKDCLAVVPHLEAGRLRAAVRA